MKKIILISLFIFIITVLSCQGKRPIAVISNGDTTIVSVQDEQLYKTLHQKYDSVIHLLDGYKQKNDSLIISNNLLRKKGNDILDSNKVYRATQLELNRFMDVCIKDPSQLVFLKGWYKRAERIK